MSIFKSIMSLGMNSSSTSYKSSTNQNNINQLVVAVNQYGMNNTTQRYWIKKKF